MAIKKVKLPDNTVVDINDPRIPGVDSTPTSGSTNVVTSGGVQAALTNGSVTKVGTTTVGGIDLPIYINAGTPTTVSRLRAHDVYGGLKTLGNTTYFVGVDPAFNYNGFAVEQGATVQFYLDGVELVAKNDSYAKSLFNGLPSTGGQPFDMSFQSTYETYSSSKSYVVGSLCSYTPSGASKVMWYRCKTACSNVLPTNTSYWEDVSASGTYTGVNPSKFTTFKYVIKNLPNSLGYENGLTLFWRVESQRPNYVTVKKLDTNNNEYTVVTNFALTGPADCIYLGQGTTSGTQNGLILEFTGFTGTTYWNLALAQVAFTGMMGSLAGVALFRGGGSVFGSIYPFSNNLTTLGTSSKRWSTVYGTNLNLNGTISGATTIGASSAITGGSFVKSGGTSSQFLKADGSVDSNTYATTSQLPAAPGTLITNATTAQTASSGEAMTGSITLHKVSKTGTYSDLVGKPTVDSSPTASSSNLVSSGGVYAALQNILSQIVSFDNVSTNQDGTLIITLSNGDTITVDLNHNHPQYPKYEHLASESQMPASPDADTMYLIDGGGGGGASIVYLTDESQMPANPDANTLYVILES